MAHPADDILTVKQVGEILGRSYNWVLKQIRLGELRAFTWNDRGSRRVEYRVERRAIEEWKRSRVFVPDSPRRRIPKPEGLRIKEGLIV